MECIIMIVFLLVGIGWIIEEIKKSTGKKKGYISNTFHNDSSISKNQNLPNGYNRQDYYDRGYSDTDIEYWGLDQPGAPDPDSAGFVIADMADGDFDGDIDFPF